MIKIKDIRAAYKQQGTRLELLKATTAVVRECECKAWVDGFNGRRKMGHVDRSKVSTAHRSALHDVIDHPQEYRSEFMNGWRECHTFFLIANDCRKFFLKQVLFYGSFMLVVVLTLITLT